MSLAVVDDNDRVIGSADYDRIHSGGLLHRFVLVYVFDKKGQLFLQKRANSKKHGGLWAESVCAHVKNGENYAQTASRRLAEELGISEMPVEVCKMKLEKFNFCHYFINSDFCEVLLFEKESVHN